MSGESLFGFWSVGGSEPVTSSTAAGGAGGTCRRRPRSRGGRLGHCRRSNRSGVNGSISGAGRRRAARRCRTIGRRRAIGPGRRSARRRRGRGHRSSARCRTFAQKKCQSMFPFLEGQRNRKTHEALPDDAVDAEAVNPRLEYRTKPSALKQLVDVPFPTAWMERKKGKKGKMGNLLVGPRRIGQVGEEEPLRGRTSSRFPASPQKVNQNSTVRVLEKSYAYRAINDFHRHLQRLRDLDYEIERPRRDTTKKIRPPWFIQA